MISYELALELKNAGFLQVGPSWICQHGFRSQNETRQINYHNHGSWCSDGKTCGPDWEKPLVKIFCTCFDHGVNEYVRNPSLSELISICGDGFASLHQSFDHNTIKGLTIWVANGYKITDNGQRVYSGELFANCSTPEEAVSRLYLALHAK